MTPKPAVVKHDARLEILLCLSGQPLTLEQASGSAGFGSRRARYHVRILHKDGLVERRRDEYERLHYVACLDDQPTWVREALEAYRVDAAK